MNDALMIGLAALFAGVISSRFVLEAALARLTADKKAQLIDGFATQRKFGVIALVGIVIALMQWPYAMAGVLAVYVIGSQVWSYRRLRTLDMPVEYLKSFAVAASLSIAGVLVYAVISLSMGTSAD